MFSRVRLRTQRLADLTKDATRQHPPSNTTSRPRQQRRTITAAPKPNSGPLMSRRSDRALPALPTLTSSHRWLRTVPLFAAIMFASTAAIFNYQKQSSSVVSSTLYALRTNPIAREVLGEEIYFASSVPWIRGEINQLHGRIDVSFWVKGTREKAKMRFKSTREGRMGKFETEEWSLETEGGRKVELLEKSVGGGDPFRQETADRIAVAPA